MSEEGEDLPSVCVLTSPMGSGDTQVAGLMEILAALTRVSLVTANLPAESEIREKFEFVNVSDSRHVDSIPRAALEFALNQLRMCRELLRRDEDVALFYGSTSYLLPVVLARLSGKTVVILPRADVPLDLRLRWEERGPAGVAWFFALLVGLLERVCYRLSHAVVSYTPAMADELGLRRYEHKLHTDGARYVDTGRFRPAVPYGERDQTVGYLGRIERNKGVEQLAEAARLLPDDVTFVFAGDGRMYDWLEAELEPEVESGDVELTGWVDHDEVPEVLGRLRLLVMPSEPTEGLPTVMLESMACGTPVLATPVSGVPDVVREGETGFLLEDVEAEAIAARVEEVLARDDLGEVSANARELALEIYSFEAAVERYRGILCELRG